MKRRITPCVLSFWLAAGMHALAADKFETLEQMLLQEGAASLAQAAQAEGDPGRGAIVFHQRRTACTKCHATGKGDSPLGPDLARPRQKGNDPVHIVESILQPSKVIEKAFQPTQILTEDGKLYLGLLLDDGRKEIKLRDASKFGEVIAIQKKKVDTRVVSKVSIMPAGVVNQLADRQQFLDLVRYLVEIGGKGPARARELEPAPEKLDSLAETLIDHARQIRSLAAADVQAGRQLYRQYCVNCHGKDGNKTVNPLARRFAKDRLKFGTDPYAMWKTISYGNGLMFPQAALLSPEDRYQIVHFLREEFIKDANPSQYFRVNDDYLAAVNERAEADAKEFGGQRTGVKLAAGMLDGRQGQQMNYGPYLCHSVAFRKPSNKNAPRFADTTERALVVTLPGEHVLCYDTERYSIAGIWRGDIASTAKTHHTSYKGNACLAPGGEVLYHNIDDRGWACGSLENAAESDLPLFEGHYLHGGQVLLRFDVGGRCVEELPSGTGGKGPAFLRTLRIGPGKETLFCLVGRMPDGRITTATDGATIVGKQGSLWASVRSASEDLSFTADATGGLWLQIPAGSEVRTLTLWFGLGKRPAEWAALSSLAVPDLDPLTKGGPRRWPQLVHTSAALGQPTEGYAADEITLPYANPWGSWMRTTALDFFSDGRAAVCTLSGDVFIVQWTQADLSDVAWSRFATGLYEPLGLRIVEDVVYVRGRDRITRLHDLNGDGEADFYENFHQAGEIGANYHAFIFDLQTDREGNFYFARSGRKSPHEGAVLRLSPDGKTSEVVCRDFRHPNGMGSGGPHDWITVSDNPHGKAVYNGVALVRPGRMYGHNGPRTTPMLAVLPPSADSSSGGQCWANPRRWGPLSGQMIHTSYSRCAAFYVLTQNIEPYPNGFAVRLPFQFKSGVMRTRVNPADGQVYLVGQKGWDTTARWDGCFYRIRYAGGASHLITAAKATSQGVELTFSCDLDPQSVKKSAIEVLREEEKRTSDVKLGGVRLLDRRRLLVELPEIGDEIVANRSHPDKKSGATRMDVRWPIRITTKIQAADGTPLTQTVYATINSLPKP